jgi:hypothetical protein
MSAPDKTAFIERAKQQGYFIRLFFICSCNDGLRPVIFKIEKTDEESVINYTPEKE